MHFSIACLRILLITLVPSVENKKHYLIKTKTLEKSGNFNLMAFAKKKQHFYFVELQRQKKTGIDYALEDLRRSNPKGKHRILM